MTLLFIRHAETDLAGRFCGHSDPPLNTKGLKQMEQMLKELERDCIDAVYTSDLVRARTTADAIGRAFGVKPVIMPELREMFFGEWEMLSWTEIELRDPVYAQRWSAEFPHLPAPGGERFEDFQSRVLRCVKELFSWHEHGMAAVVTHAGVMRVVLQAICGLEAQDAWKRTQSYCGYFRCQAGKLI
ncbi:histidine phosphatase family protein [Silvibacterium dinghuense]|uniref:Histidine phosphatase family protein n=1 Tax=Silvibacterium dinghuense TaxID=1560006 RepID=A0A4Q1SJR0_9BACT|nr:histidine phosphatase family protein [Silvibacterium dinghuense]RXS97677.1 histidine phosphatase family protein [Silvibacterium dinghuense]GGH01053.1 fructose 2,6-bisphosphatase [Silvibacterium dinghuense]